MKPFEYGQIVLLRGKKNRVKRQVIRYEDQDYVLLSTLSGSFWSRHHIDEVLPTTPGLK